MTRGQDAKSSLLIGVIFNEDGSTEGVHPDELTTLDLPPKLKAFEALREKCLDCAGTSQEVLKCVCIDCPLWPYRLGRNPKAFKARSGNPFLKRGEE